MSIGFIYIILISNKRPLNTKRMHTHARKQCGLQLLFILSFPFIGKHGKENYTFSSSGKVKAIYLSIFCFLFFVLLANLYFNLLVSCSLDNIFILH
jgi:hypothetical protein